ncbi:MAG: RCC1 domain-containing protein [Oligoflexales bacterium]
MKSILLFLMVAACGSPKGQGKHPVHVGNHRTLAGKVNGRDWQFKAGRVEPVETEDSMMWRFTLISSATDSICKKKSLVGEDGLSVIFQIPQAELLQQKLALSSTSGANSRTVTFADNVSANNIVIGNGFLEFLDIGDDINGSLDAYEDDDNAISGTYEVTRCDSSGKEIPESDPEDRDDSDDSKPKMNHLISAISSGRGFSCAIGGKQVKCWGANESKQTAVPNLVSPTLISSGAAHACAIDSGKVECWGGWAGKEDIPEMPAPTQVSTGSFFTCALADGGVKCWGFNLNGQLDVPLLENPRFVTSGQNHVCAIDDLGVKCWGDNRARQTIVPNLQAPRTVSAGGDHSCALDEEGVKCWGSNAYGETHTPDLDKPTQVSAGLHFTCALDTHGVKCWGNNEHGQLDVPPLNKPRQIAAGWTHACAIDDDGITCWGDNTSGETHPPLF